MACSFSIVLVSWGADLAALDCSRAWTIYIMISGISSVVNECVFWCFSLVAPPLLFLFLPAVAGDDEVYLFFTVEVAVLLVVDFAASLAVVSWDVCEFHL